VHDGLCFCAHLPRIATRTRVVVVTHRAEDRKSTNTGRLAALCLANSAVVVRGGQDDPAAAQADAVRAFAHPAGNDAQPLLLFPADGAIPLAQFATFSRPITLVVPDGTWGQAAKVKARFAGLRAAPSVMLLAGAPSAYRLRAQAHERGLSTIEAIARALGLLEGRAIEEALLRVQRALVERTLWTRGDLEADEVTFGIPAGAMRHDPRSGRAPRGSAC
jgi:DTW domain-containing protein YfiP